MLEIAQRLVGGLEAVDQHVADGVFAHVVGVVDGRAVLAEHPSASFRGQRLGFGRDRIQRVIELAAIAHRVLGQITRGTRGAILVLGIFTGNLARDIAAILEDDGSHVLEIRVEVDAVGANGVAAAQPLALLRGVAHIESVEQKLGSLGQPVGILGADEFSEAGRTDLHHAPIFMANDVGVAAHAVAFAVIAPRGAVAKFRRNSVAGDVADDVAVIRVNDGGHEAPAVFRRNMTRNFEVDVTNQSVLDFRVGFIVLADLFAGNRRNVDAGELRIEAHEFRRECFEIRLVD